MDGIEQRALAAVCGTSLEGLPEGSGRAPAFAAHLLYLIRRYELDSTLQRGDCVGRMPCVGQAREPCLVGFAAVQHDDRRHHHSPQGRQGRVAPPPLAHFVGIHLLGAPINPARSEIDAIDGSIWNAREEGVQDTVKVDDAREHFVSDEAAAYIAEPNMVCHE